MLEFSMMFIRHLIILWVLSILVACSSIYSEKSDHPATLKDVIQHSDVITIPLRVLPDGLMAVDVTLNEQSQARFVLDTGATKTAVFSDLRMRMDDIETAPQRVMIHGMTQKEETETITLPSLQFGSAIFTGLNVAVLSNPKQNDVAHMSIDGLIGMDILSHYRLFVDAKSSKVSFIPQKLERPFIPSSWRKIALIANPFTDKDRRLHFITVLIAGNYTPALLDTGAGFSAVNWAVADVPQLRAARRRLFNEWQIQGAVGEFSPVARVYLSHVRAGQKTWKGEEFIVMDFDALNILGGANEQLMIVGMNLLKGHNFYIDFWANELAIMPTLEELNALPRTATTIYNPDGTFDPGGSKARN